jgi:hypothetical protein
MSTPKAPQSVRAAYFHAASFSGGKIDIAAGIMRDVAIMSVGEAAGHSARVDMATLQSLFQLSQGKSIKAYINHDWNPKPTEVVGVFSGIYIDADAGVLRASQFQALSSWRKHAPQAFDTLFELAATAPDAFGVSVVIDQDLEEAPDGGYPFIRPMRFESADFVSSPAANKALFSKKEEVDVLEKTLQQNAQEPVSSVSIQPTESPKPAPHPFRMKSVFAKYADKPLALAYAVKQLAEGGDDMTEDKAIAATEAKLMEDEAAGKDATIAAQAKKISELEAQIAALMPKADEAEGMAKSKDEYAAKLADMEKQLAEKNSLLSSYAKRFGRYGIAPVVVGTGDSGAKTCTAAEWATKSPAEKSDFSRNGGRIV